MSVYGINLGQYIYHEEAQKQIKELIIKHCYTVFM